MNQSLISKIRTPLNYIFLPIKVHPLILGALALTGGITCSAAHFGATALCLFLILFLAAAKTIHHNSTKLTIMACGFFCLGFILYKHQENHYNSLYHATKNHTIDLEGTITNITTIENPRFNQIITLTVDHLWKNKQNTLLSFYPTVQLYVNSKSLPRVSDKVRLENIQIKKPSNQEFTRYLCKEGVHATIFLNKNNKIQFIETPGISWQRCIYNMRTKTHATLEQKMSPRTFCFFSSLFLGNKHNSNVNDYKELFRTWGASHHFSRSGFHLLIFIFLLELLFCSIPIAFLKKQFLIGLMCAIYAMLSWSSLGFLRALTMFFLYKICIYAQELITALHGLIIVCTCMLIFNPMQLFFLSFQLNFALTFSLAWFGQLQTQRKRPFL